MTPAVVDRTRGQGDSKHRLTVDELALFHEHIDQLACRVPEQGEIRRLLDQVRAAAVGALRAAGTGWAEGCQLGRTGNG